ncbi:unnamed protein product [Larinioides sclopetarius]|uniref:Sodium-dependent glucose transporter 1 n=1 Tax=Larinioides sclopetarius TaxID=280406 RepID=A0AAV2B721_9ARAC
MQFVCQLHFYGGTLFDFTERKQLFMTVLNFLIAISMCAIPWSRTIEMLTGWLLVTGLLMGALDTGLNAGCLNLWGKESGPFYPALHFMYGFGSLLAPLIVAPFLGDYHHETFTNGTSSYRNETLLQHPLDYSFNSTNKSDSFEIPPLTYAYSIIGGIGFLVSISFLVVCTIAPLEVGINKNETTEIKQRSYIFVTIIVILTFPLLFVITGLEAGYAQMLATYSVKGPPHLTPVIGSYLTSTFWGAFTISSFFCIFFAIKYSSLTIIIFDLIVFSAGTVVLLFLATTREWALWLATVLLGMGFASLYASVISWVERYINITNKIIGILATGGALGEMAIPYTISYFLEKTPEVLSYIVTASCVFSILLTAILYLIFINKQEKYVEKKAIPNATFDIDYIE